MFAKYGRDGVEMVYIALWGFYQITLSHDKNLKTRKGEVRFQTEGMGPGGGI